MQIPGFLHGRPDEVARRCEGLIARLAGGGSLADAVPGEWLDTGSEQGLLVLNGPSPLLRASADFQSYLPHFMIRDAVGAGRLSSNVEVQVFEASLGSPWALLGILAPANVMWVHDESRHRPLLEACLRHWDVLAGEGDRYTLGLPSGSPLWSLQTNLKYVLVHLGVPLQDLRHELPAGGLQELAATHGLVPR